MWIRILQGGKGRYETGIVIIIKYDQFVEALYLLKTIAQYGKHKLTHHLPS